ncbi:hypothetical protein NX059_008044 [Plenodomus lindquistii]|nr:hypothetical protein NX059_008044 [Plenodomus lindquistii]
MILTKWNWQSDTCQTLRCARRNYAPAATIDNEGRSKIVEANPSGYSGGLERGGGRSAPGLASLQTKSSKRTATTQLSCLGRNKRCACGRPTCHPGYQESSPARLPTQPQQGADVRSRKAPPARS